MYPGFTIDKLKILKGPDRLLRMRVRFQGIVDAEQSLYAFFEILNCLIWKNHGIQCNFKIEEFIGIFDKIDPSALIGTSYCILGSDSQISVDLLIRRYKHSEFKVSYYPHDLELERNVSSINYHVTMSGNDLSDYQPKYTLNNFREGIDPRELKSKIKFSK